MTQKEFKTLANGLNGYLYIYNPKDILLFGKTDKYLPLSEGLFYIEMLPCDKTTIVKVSKSGLNLTSYYYVKTSSLFDWKVTKDFSEFDYNTGKLVVISTIGDETVGEKTISSKKTVECSSNGYITVSIPVENNIRLNIHLLEDGRPFLSKNNNKEELFIILRDTLLNMSTGDIFDINDNYSKNLHFIEYVDLDIKVIRG